jgi:small GTP-binding protein
MKMLKKILLIGDSESGKTQIFNRYINDKFLEIYKETIGADFESKEIDNVKLQIWDMEGKERIQVLSCYKGADAVLVFVDLSKKESLENASKWIQGFKEKSTCGDDFKNIYLVGTKSDLEQKISDDEIKNFIKDHNQQEDALKISDSFYITSAKENIGINEMFKDVGNKLVKGQGQEQVGNKIVTEKQQVQDVSNKLVTEQEQEQVGKKLVTEYKIVENTKKVFLFSTFAAGSVGFFASIMLTVIFASNGLISHAACYGSLIASYVTSIAAMIPTSTILGIGAIKNGVNIHENNKQVAAKKANSSSKKDSDIKVEDTKKEISYMNMFNPTIDITETSHYL